MIVIGEHVCHFVAQRAGGEYFGGGQGIGWQTKDGVLIAGVLFDDYTGKSIRMHVAGTGKRWLSREYLRYCFYYPFIQLKVKKIIGLVDSTNTEALRFDLHLGFVLEATIRNAGRYGDIHVLSMEKNQCRFI